MSDVVSGFSRTRAAASFRWVGGTAAAVARKEMRQIGRDRGTLLILLFVPAFFLLVYGYALNFDIRHIRLAVLRSWSCTARPMWRISKLRA